MTDKKEARAVKALHDKILASAYEKPFFKKLVSEVQGAISGDSQVIFNLLGSMLGTAIWHIAYQEPMSDWKRQAEVTLLCLGGLGLDLDEFYRLVSEECKKEVDAFFFVDTSMKFGSDIETVAESLDEMLSE